MKKYLYFIISIILILLVTASVFIWKEQYKEESKSPSINNTETSNLSVNNDSNNVPETIVSDSENKTDIQITESKELETDKSNDEDNAAKEVQKPTTSTKETSTSKKETSVENNKKEESKNPVKVEEKKETVTTPSTQNKQQSTSKQDSITSNDNKKEEVKKEETVVRCTNNNNHGMGIGNSGKWFSSKDEAIAYYKSQIKYWGDWWENTSIDDTEADETYRKNCPSGYEVWDCMYCGKWTINFYYR